MIDFLFEPWPWYVTGPLIGLLVPTMLVLGSAFGVSANLETLCSIAGAGKISDYFRVDLETRMLNLLFVLGSVIGGFVAANWLTIENYSIELSSEAIVSISSLGITDTTGLQPMDIFNWNFLLSSNGLIMLCLGGFLVGFGTRYAGGCTSGHSISGLSGMQLISLIATIGFFIGGLVSTHFLIPLILTP